MNSIINHVILKTALMDTDTSVGQLQGHKVRAQEHQKRADMRTFNKLIFVRLTMLPSFGCIIKSIGLLNTEQKAKHKCEIEGKSGKQPCFVIMKLIRVWVKYRPAKSRP